MLLRRKAARYASRRSLVGRHTRFFGQDQRNGVAKGSARALAPAIALAAPWRGATPPAASRGYAYADLRNVCSSLSGAAQEAFLGEYGPFDEREAEIDAVVSVLNGLISAYGRERLPAWSAGLIEELRGGLYERVERLIGK